MKKLISILLSICLIVVPWNVSAESSSETEYIDNTETVITEIIDEEITDITPVEDELITINPDDNSPEAQARRKILAHMQANGQTVDTMAQSTGLINGGIYYIKNYFSGKYLNVHYGVDANGTNVYQWTKDSSTEQKFKVVYDSASDNYKLYAMCSSNGNNRVIDVVRNGAALASGQNVDIWTPVDHTAQRLLITNLIQNIYHIHMKASDKLYLTTNDSLNGTGGGTSSTSAGNAYIRSFDGNLNQQWAFEYIGNSSSTPSTPTGSLQSVNKNYISGWAWRSDLPNTPINVNIQIYKYGTQFLNTTVSANQYSSDLYNTCYGNGYHEFIYYYDLSVMNDGTYTVYAYAINASGNYVQLINSPMEYEVKNYVMVDCPLVSQQPYSLWCWAACAEMLGKNANPNATRTKYDVVENIKGTPDNPYPNVGGDDEDLREGAAYVSNNGSTFQTTGPLTASQIEDLIDRGIAVALRFGPIKTDNSGNNIGHGIIVYGYKDVYENGAITDYFLICDPDTGNAGNRPYSSIFDENVALRDYLDTTYLVF